MQRYRSPFVGKSSPVHFFWGGFDLAVTLFSGRRAPERPGADFFATFRKALQSLRKEDEIVVYCSEENCIACQALGQLLERNGYAHVLHFAGAYRSGSRRVIPWRACGPGSKRETRK